MPRTFSSPPTPLSEINVMEAVSLQVDSSYVDEDLQCFLDQYNSFIFADDASSYESVCSSTQSSWSDESYVHSLDSMLPLNRSLPPPSTASLASTDGGDPDVRTECSSKDLRCPIFEADKIYGRPHTCNGVLADTMSSVRRHLTRPLRGGPPHLEFLKRCPTCNEDFIDKEEFERDHGSRGELCNNVRKQRRGDSADEQWNALYQKLRLRILEASRDACLQSMSGSHASSPRQASSIDRFQLFRSPDQINSHDSSAPIPFVTDSILAGRTPTLESGSHSFTANIVDPTNSGTISASNAILESRLHTLAPSYSALSNSPWSPLNMRSSNQQLPHIEGVIENDSRASTPSMTSEAPEVMSCPICGKNFKGEYRKGNLTRHKKTQHDGEQHVFVCEDFQCQRTFRRKDARLKHYRKRHPHLSGGPLLSRKSGTLSQASPS